MITKIGRRLGLGLNFPLKVNKKKLALPFAAATVGAAHNLNNNFDASMHYVDPMDNTYYREPGIIYDTLKRNPYAHA